MKNKLGPVLIVGIFLCIYGLNTKCSHASQYAFFHLKSAERGLSHRYRHTHITLRNIRHPVRLYHIESEHRSQMSKHTLGLENDKNINVCCRKKDVIIIGGGQASLAVAYFLKRTSAYSGESGGSFWF